MRTKASRHWRLLNHPGLYKSAFERGGAVPHTLTRKAKRESKGLKATLSIVIVCIAGAPL